MYKYVIVKSSRTFVWSSRAHRAGVEEEEVISSAPITIKKLGHFKCGIPALITHPHHLLSFYKTVHFLLLILFLLIFIRILSGPRSVYSDIFTVHCLFFPYFCTTNGLDQLCRKHKNNFFDTLISFSPSF